MTNYIEIEDEEIIYHVFNLNWNLPKEIQEESIEVLIQLPPEKVDLLVPKYGKETWENAISILKIMGYPRNKKALPLLAGQLMDRNWPGTLEAIGIFKEIGKKISSPYIEQECLKALNQKDYDWLEHLQYTCNEIEIEKNDFQNPDTFNLMEKLAE